ncbi:putative ATP-dependent RNA helicase DDX28 [Discoglossus pictus]
MSLPALLCAQGGLLRATSPWLAVLRAASSSRELPVLQVPRRVQARIEKAGNRVKAVITPRAGPLLISSRRPELSQPAGETRGLWERPELVSQGWKHRLSRGDHFTIRRLQKESPKPEPDRGFEGLEHRLVQALRALGINSPTWIQSRTLPALLKGRNVLCAAETGSGKTLCYLLPMLQRLLQEDPQIVLAPHQVYPKDEQLAYSGHQEPNTHMPGTSSLASEPCANPSVNHFKASSPDEQPKTDSPRHSLQDYNLNVDTSQPNNLLNEPDNKPLLHGFHANEPSTKPQLFVSETINNPPLQSFPFKQRNKTRSPEPQNLILVPSRELANQVGSVARSLCSQLGLSVRVVGGGRGRGAVDKQFGKGPIDILVATPGALWKALRRKTVGLGELNFVVLDEADTMFDDSFSGLVGDILMHTQIASHSREVLGLERKAQLVVIGATFPGGVGEVLGKMMDLGSITTIKSKKLHFLMPHIQQTFLKIKGVDKAAELLKLLKKQAVESPRSGVLVFCNSSSTVNWLGYILDDHGIKHSRLQGQMPAIVRTGIFESFQNEQTDVLVCTDIASRGLDSRRVEVVVNYDFPATLQDYLHRVGRVGRVGSENLGTVLSFVTHAWDVELVQKIETAARRRSSLPGMESTIKEPVPPDNLMQEDPNQRYKDETPFY